MTNPTSQFTTARSVTYDNGSNGTHYKIAKLIDRTERALGYGTFRDRVALHLRARCIDAQDWAVTLLMQAAIDEVASGYSAPIAMRTNLDDGFARANDLKLKSAIETVCTRFDVPPRQTVTMWAEVEVEGEENAYTKTGEVDLLSHLYTQRTVTPATAGL